MIVNIETSESTQASLFECQSCGAVYIATEKQTCSGCGNPVEQAPATLDNSFEGVEDDSSMVSLSVPTGETAEFHGVPPILRGIASDGRVVTLAYSDGDSVTRIERTL